MLFQTGTRRSVCAVCRCQALLWDDGNFHRFLSLLRSSIVVGHPQYILFVCTEKSHESSSSSRKITEAILTRIYICNKSNFGKGRAYRTFAARTAQLDDRAVTASFE
jgi:hypothetical protein